MPGMLLTNAARDRNIDHAADDMTGNHAENYDDDMNTAAVTENDANKSGGHSEEHQESKFISEITS